MKKSILFLTILAFLTIPAFAEPITETSSRGIYNTPFDGFTDYLNSNEYFYHSHTYTVEQREFAYQIGMNVKTLDLKKIFKNQSILDSMQTEYRFDMETKQHTISSVVNVDITSLTEKLVFWK